MLLNLFWNLEYFNLSIPRVRNILVIINTSVVSPLKGFSDFFLLWKDFSGVEWNVHLKDATLKKFLKESSL